MKPSINRRSALKTMMLGAAGFGCTQILPASGAPADRPNVLFLFTDDQRFDTIRALGNEEVITPNMDKLVERGTTFTNAYIMGGMSGAVCMPSRAMIMTGRHLFHLRENGKSIPDEHAIMPEVFRKAGYDTFATGKQHNGKRAFARSFTHGGKIFFGGMSDHYKVPIRDFDPSGEYPNDKMYSDEGTHSSKLFADTAVDFLDRRDGDNPFFMYVAFTAPHDPRDMPQKYLDMYDPDSLTIPKNFLPEHPFDNGELKVRDEALAPWPRTHDIVRRHLADYYAMITHVDAQIGRVLTKLKETGEDENTIIVFAGDNGLAVGRHGLFGKQNLYEHSVHVPLIFAGPGIPEGERRHALCYIHDIFPTVCDMAGLTIPGTVESESLVPVMTRDEQEVRDAVFFAYKNFQRGVRSGRWKLIEYNVNGVRTTQLFDLLNDPWETANLAGNAEYSRYVARTTEAMRDWIRESGDPVDLGRPDWGVPVIPSWESQWGKKK